MNQSAVFASLRAQDGNLGDLVIRRYVTDAAAEAGARLHVLTKGVSASFLHAFGLESGTVFYRSTMSWTLAMLMALASKRSVSLVFTPGPQRLCNGRNEIVHLVANAFLSTAVWFGGGRVLKVGRSLAGTSSVARQLEKVVARSSAFYTVRDAPSLTALQSNRPVVRPDVGFWARLSKDVPMGAYRENTGCRSLMALSFRGDRAVDAESIRRLVVRAKQDGLRPVFVTQVREDDALHKQLAERFACEVLDWPSTVPHEDQLARVVETYELAQFVVSNRLHAIIFGLRCGADVLGLVPTGDDKLRKTLEIAGLESQIVEYGSEHLPPRLIPADDQGVVEAMRRGRDDYARLVEHLRRDWITA